MTPTTKKSKRRSVAPARPAFADAYPRHDELDRLVEAFERGNFALVRTEAPTLASRSKDDDVRDAALDLLRRIQPDPAAIYLLLLGVALVLFVYGYYVMGQ